MVAEAVERAAEPSLEAERHIGLVHKIARRVWEGRHEAVEYEDLVSSGKIGLMRALRAYDPSREIAFSTYAARRIEGEMLDFLRAQADGSRQVRRRLRAIRAAEAALASTLSRTPTHREVATKLGIDSETLWKWKQAANTTRIALDAPSAEARRAKTGYTVAETLVDGHEAEIHGRLEQSQEIQRVAAELAQLPERERMVLVLHFEKGLKLREIGEVLGVTESRVSQIRTVALARLRERLAPLR
jgi:RNA polymerase sigma factor for flagellar operon FliA